jgi:hypothetical protein
MKRLLLASILMAFGASAQAVVVVGVIECTGSFPSITCGADVTCDTNDNTCISEVTNLDNAICLPLTAEERLKTTRVIADNEGVGAPGSFCEWLITDSSDNSSTSVTIGPDEGLPVELQSLSVE